MPIVLDVDILLLLATSLAAKRRPAEPTDIIAAIDLIQPGIPNEEKLQEAFARLGSNGLLSADDAGIQLTAAAEKMIQALPHKSESAERLFELKTLMAAHKSTSNGTPIEVSRDTLQTAIEAHRTQAAMQNKNMFVPKPKSDNSQSRPGQRQRKPLGKSRKH